MIYKNNTSIILMLILVLAGSCTKENKDYTTRITVLNAVPSSQSYFLEIGGVASTGSPFAFGNLTFIEEPAATTQVQFGRAGQADPDFSLITDLPNGSFHTLLFFDSAQRYKVLFVPDPQDLEKLEEQAWIRYFPLTMGAATYAVLNDTNRVLFSQRRFADFEQSSQATTYIRTDTGTTSIKLIGIDPNQQALLDSVPGIRVAPGRRYTLYSIGVAGNTGNYRPKLIWQEH